ncbi:MAG: type II toxin-antitoxin system Phd/YefM family antitoxin [Clostridiales bacterium]|nr:type II toxin-antitoxin system Phd/YefM family antitoxin [Candidatus Crickella equi]
MDIRPVSDLRNKYTEIEQALANTDAIFLTKNGYGAAVIMSVDEYHRLVGSTPVPPIKRNKRTKSARGILREYANPDMIEHEHEAIKLHVMKKYGQGGTL